MIPRDGDFLRGSAVRRNVIPTYGLASILRLPYVVVTATAQVKTYYYRHLPHYHPPYAALFVTFRLTGSLPLEIIERLKQKHAQERRRIDGMTDIKQRTEAHRDNQRSHFDKYEALLDGASTGPRWLGIPHIAQIVSEAIHYRDQKAYELFCSCIMPNHVHMMFAARDQIPIYRILQSLKRHTGRQANLALVLCEARVGVGRIVNPTYTATAERPASSCARNLPHES